MRAPKHYLLQRYMVALACLLLYTGTSFAQKFIPPVQTENVLGTTAGVTNIASDVIDCPVYGGKLMAACYDSSGYLCTRIWHSSGINGVYAPPPIANATDADIAVGDATTYPSGQRYMVLVTYVKNGQAYVTKYLASFPGINLFSYTLRSTTQLSHSRTTAKKPRIDMLPDTSLLIGGYPSYHTFVTTWVENNDSIYCGVGEVHHLSPVTSYAVQKMSNSNGCADIAGIKNILTNENIACIVYKDSLQLKYTELNLSAVNPVATLPLVVSSGASIGNEPRIEAMNLYDPTLNTAKWEIVTSQYDATAGKWKAYSYNSLGTGGTDCIGKAMCLGNVQKPVVAAGIGKLGGSFFVGNNNYIVGWKHSDTTKHYAQYINVNTGRALMTVDTLIFLDTSLIRNTIQLHDTTFVKDTLYTVDTTYTSTDGGKDKNNKGKGKGNQKDKSNNGKGKGKDDNEVMVIDTVSVQYIDTFYVTSRDSDYYTIKVNERKVPDTNKNFYQINNEDCSYGTLPLSIASPQNTGNGTLSVWYDGTAVKYKFIYNRIGFRTNEEKYDIFGRSIPNVNSVLSSLRAYPIPAHDILNIEGADNASYIVCDVTGRVVMSGKLDERRIYISSLNPGIYILKTLNNEQIAESIRFVKE